MLLIKGGVILETEKKLKDFILQKYKSIRAFTHEADIPYSTIDTMFKRGIGGTSIDTVIKICKTLGISTDDLAVGKITPLNRNDINIDNSLSTLGIKNLIYKYEDIDAYGKKIIDFIVNEEYKRTKEQQQKQQSTNSNNIVEISKTENEEAPEIVFYESARDTYGTKDKYNTDLTPENIKKLKKLVEDAKDGELDDEYENS